MRKLLAGVLVLHIKICRSLLKTYMYILHAQNPCFLSGLITTFFALLWNACTYMRVTIHMVHCVCVGWCREVLGDGAETEGHTLLHGPDRHPDADQEGR